MVTKFQRGSRGIAVLFL